MKGPGLRSNRFFSLLQKLGLLPISREPGFYPCIPHNWSPNIMLEAALIFGPIDQTMVDSNNFRRSGPNPCAKRLTTIWFCWELYVVWSMKLWANSICGWLVEGRSGMCRIFRRRAKQKFTDSVSSGVSACCRIRKNALEKYGTKWNSIMCWNTQKNFDVSDYSPSAPGVEEGLFSPVKKLSQFEDNIRCTDSLTGGF